MRAVYKGKPTVVGTVELVPGAECEFKFVNTREPENGVWVELDGVFHEVPLKRFVRDWE